jgi:hypothetical protein
MMAEPKGWLADIKAGRRVWLEATDGGCFARIKVPWKALKSLGPGWGCVTLITHEDSLDQKIHIWYVDCWGYDRWTDEQRIYPTKAAALADGQRISLYKKVARPRHIIRD